MGNSSNSQTKLLRTSDTLWQYVVVGDYDAGMELLTKGEGVDYCDPTTKQSLARLALEKRCPIGFFEALMKHKPLAEPDGKGYTIVHYAAQFNLTPYLAVMLSNGAPARPQTKDKLEPIDYASQSGAEYKLLKLLIEHGARADHMTPLGTPLHLHLISGKSSAEVMRLLVKDGLADVNAVFDGHTPLLLATKNGLALDVIKELVELGSDVNSSTNGLVSFLGMTPYAYAKKFCTADVIKFLANPPAIPPPKLVVETPTPTQPTAAVTDGVAATTSPPTTVTFSDPPPAPPPSRTSNVAAATVRSSSVNPRNNSNSGADTVVGPDQRRPSQNIDVLKAKLNEKDEELALLKAEAERNRQQVTQLTQRVEDEERKRILAEERLHSFSVASEVASKASNYQNDDDSTQPPSPPPPPPPKGEFHDTIQPLATGHDG